jgi:uncharacterized phage infection (PIP) family protein YhgE
MPVFLEFAKNFGLPMTLVAFFVWWNYKRESAISKKLDEVRDYVQEKLADLTQKSTQVAEKSNEIAEKATDALSQASATFDRVSKVLNQFSDLIQSQSKKGSGQ